MFPTEDVTTSDLFKMNKVQGITGSQLPHVIWMGKCQLQFLNYLFRKKLQTGQIENLQIFSRITNSQHKSSI